jgi:RNA polymerase sigma-70 factor (ECF subfamily)
MPVRTLRTRDPLFDEMMTHLPKLRRYARSLTRDYNNAEDLTQAAITRCFTKIHLFQRNTDLRAWMFTIMHNEYVNYVRRETKATLVPLDATVREGVGRPGRGHNARPFNTGVVRGSLHSAPNQIPVLGLRDMERALNKLPVEQRSVIMLVAVEGLAYEEVAVILDIPVGTVRSRLSRGRDRLRELMFGESADEITPPGRQIRFEQIS